MFGEGKVKFEQSGSGVVGWGVEMVPGHLSPSLGDRSVTPPQTALALALVPHPLPSGQAQIATLIYESVGKHRLSKKEKQNKKNRPLSLHQ